MTLNQIARLIEAEVVGSAGEVEITGVSGVEDAGAGDLTFAENARLLAQARGAAAVIVPPDVGAPGMPALRVANPRLAFARALALFAPKAVATPGIHATAVVSGSAEIAASAQVGALCFIGERARVGGGSIIHPLVYLGDDVSVGEEAVIYPNVTICQGTQLGARAVIHPGVVIGADGFGFTPAEGRHHKIPQTGRVVVGDDVEVGANVCIDRATTGATVIGDGTKIDNLVQIGHNAKVGRDCIIVAQVGIAGSVRLGDGAIMAARAGASDHVSVGEGAVVMANSAAMSDVPAHAQVFGFPAQPHRKALRGQVAVVRLPEMMETIRDLRRRIAALEAQRGP